jgi:hypothetical protein
MKRMKTISWLLGACLLAAVSAQAQSQFQSTFEMGIGYTRTVAGGSDMVSALLQADDFLIETGVGIRTNSGAVTVRNNQLYGGDTVFSWMVRGGVRPFVLGNVTGHVGAEFDLQTNSAVDETGDIGTLLGLGFLVGASHAVADHLNLSVHVYPIAFEFGGEDTVAKLLTATFGAHLLF